MNLGFGPEMVCVTCGTTGRAQSYVPGSFLLELTLWIVGLIAMPFLSFLVVLIPIAYSVYRLTGRKRRCAACHASTLVPVDSPAGRQLLERFRPAPQDPAKD